MILKKAISFAAVLFLIINYSVNAQQQSIHGKVTAFNNLPLANAEVTVKKSKKMVLTNFLGGFVVEAQKNDKVSIKAGGFRSTWFKIKDLNDSIKANLTFGEDDRDIRDAVNGGHIDKEKLIAAIEKMEAEKFSGLGYTTISQMVTGIYPEVSYINNEFRMRGTRSLNGSNAALIVLNGGISTVGSIENIPVDEVKSIKVLKGPAAAIYGSRGSNGVVEIKTK